MKRQSLSKLFLEFLKIGSVTFGGSMSLVAQIEVIVVNRLHLLESEDVLDGILVVSIVPGLNPTNVAIYVGNQLQGIRGALACLSGMILPAFILVVGMAALYFRLGHLLVVEKLLLVLVPLASARILHMAIHNTKRTVKKPINILIMLFSLFILLTVQNVYTPILVIICSGLLGLIKEKLLGEDRKQQISLRDLADLFISKQWFYASVIILFLCIALVFFWQYTKPFSEFIYFKIFTAFTGISLMLFGGGHAGISLMEHVLVNELHWLTPKDFAVAILLGQVTPGPGTLGFIMAGQKVGGFVGAAIATVGFFLPSSILVIFSAKILNQLKSSQVAQAILAGIRPVVVSMTYYAAWAVAKGVQIQWSFIVIFLTTFLMLQFFRSRHLRPELRALVQK